MATTAGTDLQRLVVLATTFNRRKRVIMSASERWRFFPCVYCNKDIDTKDGSDTNWHGVGHPMSDSYAHYVCNPDDLRARITELGDKLYRAEAVCWAKYRIDQVGDRSVHPDEDQRHYANAWDNWKAAV